jgi:F0F1-type ATP synthase assembly protein I
LFKKPRDKSPYFLLAMDFGYTLLASIGVFGWLGYWLDHRYGTTPWFMLLGFALGLAIGFNSLFRRLNLLETKEKAKRKAKSQQPPEKPPS